MDLKRVSRTWWVPHSNGVPVQTAEKSPVGQVSSQAFRSSPTFTPPRAGCLDSWARGMDLWARQVDPFRPVSPVRAPWLGSESTMALPGFVDSPMRQRPGPEAPRWESPPDGANRWRRSPERCPSHVRHTAVAESIPTFQPQSSVMNSSRASASFPCPDYGFQTLAPSEPSMLSAAWSRPQKDCPWCKQMPCPDYKQVPLSQDQMMWRDPWSEFHILFISFHGSWCVFHLFLNHADQSVSSGLWASFFIPRESSKFLPVA